MNGIIENSWLEGHRTPFRCNWEAIPVASVNWRCLPTMSKRHSEVQGCSAHLWMCSESSYHLLNYPQNLVSVEDPTRMPGTYCAEYFETDCWATVQLQSCLSLWCSRQCHQRHADTHAAVLCWVGTLVHLGQCCKLHQLWQVFCIPATSDPFCRKYQGLSPIVSQCKQEFFSHAPYLPVLLL